MTKKERKLFNEYRLTPIIILFCLAKDLNNALSQLDETSLLSDKEKQVVKPMLPDLFAIDKSVRDFIASKRLNPLTFLDELNKEGYTIIKKEV